MIVRFPRTINKVDFRILDKRQKFPLKLHSSWHIKQTLFEIRLKLKSILMQSPKLNALNYFAFAKFLNYVLEVGKYFKNLIFFQVLKVVPWLFIGSI